MTALLAKAVGVALMSHPKLFACKAGALLQGRLARVGWLQGICLSNLYILLCVPEFHTHCEEAATELGFTLEEVPLLLNQGCEHPKALETTWDTLLKSRAWH